MMLGMTSVLYPRGVFVGSVIVIKSISRCRYDRSKDPELLQSVPTARGYESKMFSTRKMFRWNIRPKLCTYFVGY